MTRELVASIPRQTARDLITSIPGGQGYDDRLILAVEQAMNLEWWRGFYACREAVGLDSSGVTEQGGTDGR